MKYIITLVLMSLMSAGCPKEIADGPTPQAIVVLSDPAPVAKLDNARAAKKKALCAIARKTAKEISDVLRTNYKGAKVHVVGCEVADTTAYFIVSMEQIENDILIRKVDVIHLAIFSNGEWVVMHQEPLMREGTAYEEELPPLVPVPDLDQATPTVKRRIIQL